VWLVVRKSWQKHLKHLFGSCLDKAEEVMGALTRVVTTQRTTVENVRSSRVCTNKAEVCKGVGDMGLSSQVSGFLFEGIPSEVEYEDGSRTSLGESRFGGGGGGDIVYFRC
jgi:hypothetical protein